MKNRVLIADDHPIVRSGIITELSRYPDYELAGEATSGDEALRMTLELCPDVLLLDVNMPGKKAYTVIQEVKRSVHPCKILVLTAYDDKITELGMLRAGVDGYFLKGDDPNQLPDALRAILAGETWLSQSLEELMLDGVVRWDEGASAGELSKREQEVLRLLSQGYKNKDIADTMEISERTVIFHVSNILEKLNLKGRVEAAIWAKENGY